MSFRRFTLEAKLMCGFATLLTLVLAVGYGSYRTIDSLGADLGAAVGVTAKKMALSDSLLSGFREVRLAAALTEISLVNATMLADTKTSEGGARACAGCHGADDISSNERALEAAFRKVDGAAAELEALVADPGEREQLRAMAKSLAQWHSLYAGYLQLVRERGFAGAHEVMLADIYPRVASLEEAAATVHERQDQQLNALRREAAAKRIASSRRTGAAIAVSLILGAIVLLIIRRATRVLRGAAGEIAGMTGRLAAATDQIAAASQSLAETATEQSDSLAATCASSGEIRAASADNLEAMRAASETTFKVNEQVEGANRTLAHTVAAMREIDASAGKISHIARTIDEIAFQTNLLSLNAAIEAARAGEAGLAFGIVADEVRRLAGQCGAAAQETSGLVAESLAASGECRSRMEDLAAVIAAITGLAGAVREKVESVNGSSQRQQHSVADLGQVLKQMEKATASIAACADQNASASDDLRTQAATLREVTAGLQALVG